MDRLEDWRSHVQFIAEQYVMVYPIRPPVSRLDIYMHMILILISHYCECSNCPGFMFIHVLLIVA